VDCWRFYPDSGVALQNWGNRSGYDCALLESFIGVRKNDLWHDFVAVFVKDKKQVPKFTMRIQDNTADFMNGRLLNSEHIIKPLENFTNTQITLIELEAVLRNIKIQHPDIAEQLVDTLI
jgi:hypothetical protein